MAPTGLAAAELASGQIQLTWDLATAPGRIAHYDAHVTSDGVSMGFIQLVGTTGQSTSAIYPRLSWPVGTHVFHIRGVNADGIWGPVSDASNDVVIAIPAPNAPTGLSAVAVGLQVTLTWNDPSDSTITSYEFQRVRDGVTFGWEPIANSDATTTSFVRTETVIGNYVYRIRAINAGGTSAVSNDASVAVGSAPAQPMGLGATYDAGTQQVTLTWTDPSDSTITLYEYEFTDLSLLPQAWQPMTGVTASDTTYLVGQVGYTTGDYSFRIRATNVIGTSTPSASASVTVP